MIRPKEVALLKEARKQLPDIQRTLLAADKGLTDVYAGLRRVVCIVKKAAQIHTDKEMEDKVPLYRILGQRQDSLPLKSRELLLGVFGWLNEADTALRNLIDEAEAECPGSDK